MIVFVPSTRSRGNDAVPDPAETKEPLPSLICTVESVRLVVAVTVSPARALLMEYARFPDVNAGERDPVERASPESVASSDRV